MALALSANGADSLWYERAWQSAEGLPDNSVSGVAQTPDGFLWVGTAGGLMRFDGVRFEEFPLVTLDGVPNHVVRALLLDAHGRLWLGMDRGPIVCLAPHAVQVFTNVPDARASYLAEDAAGAVWVTYTDGGLIRVRDGQVTVFNSASGWPESGLSSLTSDRDGRLWFGKGNRVGIFQQGKFQTLLTFPETVWCLARRRAGGIWLCAGHRLLSYDGGGTPRQFGELPVRPSGIEVTVLFEDSSGALWIGTAANGLFRCDGTNTTAVPTSYRSIACLAQDREGNLWVGTGGGGLDRLRPRIIGLLGTDTGLPYESVRSICEDTAGAIWVTMQNGLLARWQSNVWSQFPENPGAPTGFFSCVAADPHGGLWIGTRDHGFYHWRDGECRNWRQADGLGSDDVRCILQTRNGDVYISTDAPSHPSPFIREAVVSSGFSARLQRLRDGRLQPLAMSLQTRSLRALVEDAAGRVWAGSADGRLLRVDGDRLVDETPGVTNRLLSIRCLCATLDGSLWIGYAGWGLGWLKDGHFARITSEQGLYDDYVSQLVDDGRGWLWCAGNHGIFEVKLEQLRAVAEGRQNRVRSLAYSRGEGFPNLQPNYENVPGALRSRDGRLWFPMHTGLAVIHPDRVPSGAPPPPVRIEQVTVDGRVVARDDRYLPSATDRESAPLDLSSSNVVLRLPPRFRKLDFVFTALSFTAPENVEFEYRLRGLDDNWVEGGTARGVSYPHLPPGNYRFEVRAASLTDQWSPQSAALNFVVRPFFWQTWWFRAGGVVMFTLSVAGLVRYVSFRRLHRRLRALEQQAALQRERARIAKDIHDDLGAHLTQIAYLGELAQQDLMGKSRPAADSGASAAENGWHAQTLERIGKISATARQAVRALDEIVWAVNPRNDTPAHLIDYAGQFALDYLRTAGIRCRLDFPEQSPARELSTDLRHNLFLVIKEALHNIVKHAHATEVWLRARFDLRGLEMVIEDNGCGFEHAPDDALADGLRNMQQRMNDIGGDCRWESQSGRGTRVTLHLPWPEEHPAPNIIRET